MSHPIAIIARAATNGATHAGTECNATLADLVSGLALSLASTATECKVQPDALLRMVMKAIAMCEAAEEMAHQAETDAPPAAVLPS